MKKAKREELLKLLKDLTIEIAHIEFIGRGEAQVGSQFTMVERDKLIERAREAIRNFDK